MITKEIFEAFIRCPTKAFLKGSGLVLSRSRYDEWHQQNKAQLRSGSVDFLLKGTDGKSIENPTHEQILNSDAKLLIDCQVTSGNVQSKVDAIERSISSKRGSEALVPIRFMPNKKIDKQDRLLVAFDAWILSKAFGNPPTFGKLIQGFDERVRKIRVTPLISEIQSIVRKIEQQLSHQGDPAIVLNRHCVECGFRDYCRDKSIEKDDLSLLSNMSLKERKKNHDKGIFTVTQLSYTFRPRRRRKNPQSRVEKHSNALRALAIREKKIHIAGDLQFEVKPNDGFLDVEGIPDRDFYFLVGFRGLKGDQVVQYSFWADDQSQEKEMWSFLLQVLREHRIARIIHYGSFETQFLRRMKQRYCESKTDSTYVESLIRQSVNLLSLIYGRVYFPTHSNGLKDVAQHLNYKWPGPILTGYEAMVVRIRWEYSRENGLKEELIKYNLADCEALELVAKEMVRLSENVMNRSSNASADVVNTNDLRWSGRFKFGRLYFANPEFDYINRASYWNYQREKIVLRSNRLSRRITIDKKTRGGRSPINKMIECRRAIACRYCRSRKVNKYGPMTKLVHDLKFSGSSIKRWIVKYRFHRYICWTCRRTFVPRSRPWTGSKFGMDLMRYVIFHVIDLQIPQRTVTKMVNQFFGMELSPMTLRNLKEGAAQFYKDTYKSILKNITSGQLVHVDETKVNINGTSAYVWALANQEYAAYFHAETREGSKVQELLKDFKGVLVSDFYSVYDSFDCPQQKCLIHLIRDLNDDLMRQPFNEELKSLVNNFSFLVKPMIETVDRRGLKARFLRKHKLSVPRFYRWLAKSEFQTEVPLAYKKRFEKNRDKLFTFLDYDDVPWNNNAAEHAIKAFARLRRVLGGKSTEKGIQEYLVLLSVCETCRYRGINFLEFLCSGCKDVDQYITRNGRRRDQGMSAVS